MFLPCSSAVCIGRAVKSERPECVDFLLSEDAKVNDPKHHFVFPLCLTRIKKKTCVRVLCKPTRRQTTQTSLLLRRKSR